MKILMSTPVPFFRPRGTPLSTLNRCKVLTNWGYEIDLLTYPIGEDVDMKNLKVIRTTKLPFVSDIGMGPSIKMFLLDVLLSFKMLMMHLKENYDCIHAHEETIFMGVILKKIFKEPLIYDMHSSISEQLTNYSYTKSKFLINLVTYFEKWAVRNSDIIIVICPHLREVVSSISPEKKVVLIENRPVTEGVEPSSNMIEKLRTEVELKNEKVILYTGSFGTNQGLEMFLETLPFVLGSHDAKYVLVGGDPKRIEHLKKLCLKLGINESVVFTGPRPIEEMPAFMALADILVSPRAAGTNTPLKIYSYLESGRPIVATDLLTHTQVLDKEISILVKPKTAAFAEGIIYLLDNPEHGRLIGEKAREIYRERYSYDRFVEKTGEVYEYLAGD